METDTEEKFVFRRARPLETSLVEWKRYRVSGNIPDFLILGNFLSGMETFAADRRPGRRICLGNFLSGMETRR